jgi:hypothetical protein
VDYPRWIYYPNSATPPAWTADLLGAVAAAAESIDSRSNSGLTSDKVLVQLRPALERLGYHVEASKRHLDKVRRPVLFGEQGRERVAYEADAVHDSLGVLLEIEAGRGAMGNAVYRDLVRTSLIVGARFLALGVMLATGTQRRVSPTAHRDTKELLDAVYASGRLGLPFEGLLLFGY